MDRPPLSDRLRLRYIGGCAAVLLLASLCAGYVFAYHDVLLPRTLLGGVPVGGMTRAEAEAAAATRAGSFLDEPLELRSPGRTFEVPPRLLGVTADAAAAAESAWNAQKRVPFIKQIRALISAPVRGHAYPIVISRPDPAQFHAAVAAAETAYTETSLKFAPGTVETVIGRPGRQADVGLAAEGIRAAFSGGGAVSLDIIEFRPQISALQSEPARVRAEMLLAGPLAVRLADRVETVSPATLASWMRSEPDGVGLRLSFDAGSVAGAVREWAGRTDRQPSDAVLAVQPDGSVGAVKDGGQGRSVDVPGTVAAVAAVIYGNGGPVIALVAVTEPNVSAAALLALGLTARIGTNTTDFTGSPTNRAFNIGVGQRKLNALLVRDGETFSTTGNLGDVDASTGYRPELVIKGSRTVPEYGGGLCQVSTTLFRAVLNAGLPILARQNHSYRVGYYERGVGPGLDATVYIPNPDLKWKNDTGRAVYVQSRVEGTKITFDLFGTPDGRVSTVSPPTILENYPVGDPIYADSSSLPAGTVKQVETAHDGAKTSVTYTVSRAGQEVYRREFLSVYRAWPAQFLRGTDQG